jgi:DNA-binding beta-propeller fold protein YncE
MKKLIVCLALGALICAFCGLPALAQEYQFILKWGTYGSGDGQFYYPHGVAVDSSSGNVYAADTLNNRIQKFNSSGGFITEWGSSRGSRDGQFQIPCDIAVDSSGNVYVADSWNNRIQKFTSSGRFLTKWGTYGTGDGQFAYPQGVAVDPSGNVYVVDTYSNRIQKFDSSGVFITKWGCWGEGDGQFQEPLGIAVDSSGNVYVVDRYNHRIQKFTSSGGFITKWGTHGSGDGQFIYPQGVAVDPSRNVYVADQNNRIQKFTSNGTFITKWGCSGSGWGNYGSGDGQFYCPFGVAVDSSWNVYVADTMNNRIQKFTPLLPPPPPSYQPITGNPEVDAAMCVLDNKYTDPETGLSTHGTYVSAVANKVVEMRMAGKITKEQGGEIVKKAAQSSVNMP